MNNYIEEAFREWAKSKPSFEGQVWLEDPLDHMMINDGYYNVKDLFDRIAKKQQDIIKECLPEKLPQLTCLNEYAVEGFNGCRQQFLDNLSKKGINLE